MREARTLGRDTDVLTIPYGEKILLKAGTTVFVTQALGGSFTAMTDMGYMVRIDGQDADSIGEEKPPAPSSEEQAKKSLEELAWDQMKTCYDPEIPVNIVDLGLVYSLSLDPVEDGKKATVRFTLTAPGCGMGDVLRVDIERKLLSLPGVKEVDVQLALDPPWDQSRMSEAAKLQLGLM